MNCAICAGESAIDEDYPTSDIAARPTCWRISSSAAGLATHSIVTTNSASRRRSQRRPEPWIGALQLAHGVAIQVLAAEIDDLAEPFCRLYRPTPQA
jgi:hypothetical protein